MAIDMLAIPAGQRAPTARPYQVAPSAATLLASSWYGARRAGLVRLVMVIDRRRHRP